MPSTATPKLEQFAERLLEYETASSKPAGAEDFAAFRVCDKLRGPLCKVLGLSGFRGLLSRALALAGEEVPWLHTLYVRSDSSLEGLNELKETLDPDSVAAGEIALAAELVELLVIFIGPALTLGLIRDAWPEAVFDDLDFGNEPIL